MGLLRRNSVRNIIHTSLYAEKFQFTHLMALPQYYTPTRPVPGGGAVGIGVVADKLLIMIQFFTFIRLYCLHLSREGGGTVIAFQRQNQLLFFLMCKSSVNYRLSFSCIFPLFAPVSTHVPVHISCFFFRLNSIYSMWILSQIVFQIFVFFYLIKKP